MGLKKKKNIIIVTVCVVLSFIIYQLYFFLAITSETNNTGRKVIPVFEHKSVNNKIYVRSEHDKFINNDGVLKGVFYSQMPRYRPDTNNEFKCLKSEQKIPFENVNDDYCDCEDGTDEPSTSACVNGTFYCDTQHHKKLNLQEVPSSKVNDGICDCCDGSDEWLHREIKLLSQSNAKHYRFYMTQCPNKCEL